MYSIGTFLINGQSSGIIEFSDGTPIQLGVWVGYFVADKLAIEGVLVYLSNSFGSDTNFGLGFRYNIFNKLSLGALYDFDASIFTAKAGYDFFIANNVSFSPTFNLPFDDFQDPNLNLGFSIFLK